ncbi:MAG TPA: zf-HC2 domain-containing protein, partial [Dehalococcoidia bacterium]|nr:zf-HC2 domain-containing protein [Dehalococcoidia bacterium]
MLWLRSHRWYRDQLSAYLDGELADKDALRVNTHLESCDACAAALADFRAASALLSDLPDLNVPRSFALTAADVAPREPARVTGLAHSANSGLRIAGAGLAAALAVVLVLDLGGIVGGGESEAPSGVAYPLQQLSARDSGTGQDGGAAAPTMTPSSKAAVATGSAGASGPMSGGGVAGAASSSTETPTPAVEPPHSGGVGSGQSGAGSAQTPLLTPAPATARTDAMPAPTPQPATGEPYGLEAAPAASPSTAPGVAAFDMTNGTPETDNRNVTNTSSTADSDGGPS